MRYYILRYAYEHVNATIGWLPHSLTHTHRDLPIIIYIVLGFPAFNNAFLVTVFRETEYVCVDERLRQAIKLAGELMDGVAVFASFFDTA